MPERFKTNDPAEAARIVAEAATRVKDQRIRAALSAEGVDLDAFDRVARRAAAGEFDPPNPLLERAIYPELHLRCRVHLCTNTLLLRPRLTSADMDVYLREHGWEPFDHGGFCPEHAAEIAERDRQNRGTE